MIIDHQDDLGTYLRQFSPELASSVFVKEASLTKILEASSGENCLRYVPKSS